MKTKICILVLFFLILVSILSLNAFALSERFIDKTGLLSNLEYSLEDKLNTLSNKHDVHILIYAYTYDENTAYHLSDEEILLEYNLVRRRDNILLLILEKYSISGEWHCFISTYGTAYDKISDGEINYMLKDGSMLDYALTVNMQEGLNSYLDFIDNALSVNAVPVSERIATPILLALLGAGIAFLCVFIPYKRKVRSDCYPLKEFTNMNLTYSDDQFTGKTVTKRHAPRSKGSSGSGGGGGRRGGR